jgi:hypothetical protein
MTDGPNKLHVINTFWDWREKIRMLTGLKPVTFGLDSNQLPSHDMVMTAYYSPELFTAGEENTGGLSFLHLYGMPTLQEPGNHICPAFQK